MLEGRRNADFGIDADTFQFEVKIFQNYDEMFPKLDIRLSEKFEIHKISQKKPKIEILQIKQTNEHKSLQTDMFLYKYT